jgi:hypothetical protein
MAAHTAEALLSLLAVPETDGLMRLLREEPDERRDQKTV